MKSIQSALMSAAMVLLMPASAVSQSLLDRLVLYFDFEDAEGLPLLYWDVNGEVAGAGGPSPNGDWGGLNWTSDASGSTETTAWTPGGIALFAAGEDATGGYEVTLGGAQEVSAVVARSGMPTLSGGTLELGGLNALGALDGAVLSVDSALEASHLSTSGSVSLGSPADIAGAVRIDDGELSVVDGTSFGGLTGGGGLAWGGTVTLAPESGAAFSFSGDLDGTGTLRVEGPGQQSLVRDIDGFDGVIEVAGGTTLLSGVVENAGGVDVSGGLLVAADDLPVPFTLGEQGTLAAGTTPDAGAPTQIRLGEASETIFIDGTLRFSLNGSSPDPEVNDRMQMLGNVVFGVGSVIYPSFTGTFETGNAYEIIWVDGIRTGTPVIDPALQDQYRYSLVLADGTFFPNDLVLEVSGAAASLVWVGDGVDNIWDIGGAQNWSDGGVPSSFLIPDAVVFDDTGDNTVPVEIAEDVTPSTVIVNSTKDYIIAGPGRIIGAAGLTKEGTGTLVFTGDNAYTGQTMVRNGQFEIGSGASLSGTSRINALDDGELIVSGTATVGDNGQFAIGMGEASAGTVTVASGGTLNIGNGSGGTVGFTGMGGRFLSSGSVGHGTLNINGTVNLAAGGTGAAGLDGLRFWLNPYLRGGSATINLNSGGVLNAARPISHGGGGGPGSSNFYFDGGILRAAGNIILLQTQTDPIISHMKSGGAFVDTDGFNATIQSPMHDDGGPGNFTKQGEGSLTVSGTSSFTGDITITAGELITSLQRNVANPTTSALGNLTVEGRTVTVESGATLTFGNVNDSLGSFQYKTPVTMVADGGTIQNGSGRFLSIGDIVLKNGGVFNTQNGAADAFQTFNLRGSITVEGTSGALITTTGTLRTGIHLGGTTIAPTTFDVSATGDPTADLIVSVPLLDEVHQTAGGLIKAGAGRMVLAAANTYSGDTVVQSGTLVLEQATLADGSSVFLNAGAVLELPHGESDTIAALWINGVQQPAGVYDVGNSGGAITGTGSLMVTDGPSAPGGFADWIDGFFPGETDPAIVGPEADANGDGVANALVYLLGGDPKDGNNQALLPTVALASDPGNGIPDGDYLVFTFRRSAAAVAEGATSAVEHSTTLTAPWTVALHGVDGVVVDETPDGFDPGIDRVEVFIPRAAHARLFGRLGVTLP